MLSFLILAPFAMGTVGAAVPPAFDDAEELRRRRITPIVQVARDASPAVVYIQNTGTQVVRDIFGSVFRQTFSGTGSGFVIKKEGFIITNYHVVRGAQQLKVSFQPEMDPIEYDATVVSFDDKEDLALLKIPNEKGKEFPTVTLGKSDDLMLGETVIAIGNPYGQTHTVNQGIISGLHREVPIPSAHLHFDNLIQTDAPINPGNSGGPLLNINGEVIGITSAMNMQAQNIGFAIPIDRVRAVFSERLTSLDAAETWLGFDVAPDHLRVADVVAGGPAAQAGLKTGDCIVGVGSQRVQLFDDYRLARLGLSPAHEVELVVERNGEERRVKMQPWDRSEGILYSHLGLRAETRYERSGGKVVVLEVRAGGPADEVGMKPGDILDAVQIKSGGRAQSYGVYSHENLAQLVSQLSPGTRMVVELFRDLDKNGYFTDDELHRGTLTVR